MRSAPWAALIPAVPLLVVWIRVFPATSARPNSAGELPKSKPGGDAVSFPDAVVADARTAKCDGFVKGIDHYDAMGAMGEGDGGRREGAEDVDDNCCADRRSRTADQTRQADLHVFLDDYSGRVDWLARLCPAGNFKSSAGSTPRASANLPIIFRLA